MIRAGQEKVEEESAGQSEGLSSQMGRGPCSVLLNGPFQNERLPSVSLGRLRRQVNTWPKNIDVCETERLLYALVFVLLSHLGESLGLALQICNIPLTHSQVCRKQAPGREPSEHAPVRNFLTLFYFVCIIHVLMVTFY